MISTRKRGDAICVCSSSNSSNSCTAEPQRLVNLNSKTVASTSAVYDEDSEKHTKNVCPRTDFNDFAEGSEYAIATCRLQAGVSFSGSISPWLGWQCVAFEKKKEKKGVRLDNE